MGYPGIVPPPKPSSVGSLINNELFQSSFVANEEITALEKRVDEFESHLRSFLQLVNKVYQHEKTTFEHSTRFSSELLHFVDLERDRKEAEGNRSSSKMDTIFEPSMRRIGGLIRNVDELRMQLYSNIENLFLQPLQEFLNTELPVIRDLRRLFEKCCEDYELEFARLSQIPNGSKKKAEQLSLIRQKRLLDNAMYDYVRKMKEIESRKTFEFLERLCSYMVLQTAYFHEGYDLLQEFSSYLREMTISVTNSRGDFAASEATLIEGRKTLERRKDSAICTFGHSNDSVPASPTNDSGSEVKVAFEGFLMKRSSSVRKDWKKRYFILFGDGNITYRRSWREISELGRMSMLTAAVKPISSKDVDHRDNCFEIISPSRRMVLQAPTLEECKLWTSTLTSTIGGLLSQMTSEKAPPMESLSNFSPTDLTEDGNVVSVLEITSNTTSTRGQKIPPLEAVKSFDPLNSLCADCSSPNPQWISLNLGVCLCISCGGVHRSLGVHVSKVRSLTLDTIDRVILDVFYSLGNGRMNSLLEYNLKPEDKPTPDSPIEDKIGFIRAKYINREYTEFRPPNLSQMTEELFVAVTNDDLLSVASLVVVHGLSLSSVRVCNENGYSPMHVAAENNLSSMCEYLFHNECPLNRRSKMTRETALHLASESNAIEAAKVLIRHGAFRSILNAEGKTAFELACERGWTQMAVAVIVDKGQDEKIDEDELGDDEHCSQSSLSLSSSSSNNSTNNATNSSSMMGTARRLPPPPPASAHLRPTSPPTATGDKPVIPPRTSSSFGDNSANSHSSGEAARMPPRLPPRPSSSLR